MPIVQEIKTNFTAGEVSPDLLGRTDLRGYENGAARLRNTLIAPTGGISRRAGLRMLDTLDKTARLITFAFNTQQTYLLLLSDKEIKVYLDGVLETTVPSPWNADQIFQVAWTQSADTLLLTHPDVPAQKLLRLAPANWLLEQWEFLTDENIIYQPYFKFADDKVTLTPSGTTGIITITASSGVFTQEHEGTRIRIAKKQLEVTDFDSATVISAQVIEDLPNTDTTIDWDEAVFSEAHGWPLSSAFHQDRLVIGGSRDLPNRLFFSKSGDLFNFDLGEGLDDESIAFSLLSDQINVIRGILSGSHLQVFTSGAEWMVTGDPLTPTSIQINRQTQVGSITKTYVPPIAVDGATLFASRSGRELREFIYTDIEQAYSSTDLALLSRHIIIDPIDQAYDPSQRILFMVREDGKIAALTVFRAEKVSAWTLLETSGAARSVAVAGDIVYIVSERDGQFALEQFDKTLNTDAGLTGSSPTPIASWSGLSHLEGKEVAIIADGIVRPRETVRDGSITLNEEVSEIEVGLPFTHEVESLPASQTGQAGSGLRMRPVKITFRLKDTPALCADTGRGFRAVPLRRIGSSYDLLDAEPEPISGDIEVRAYGWHQRGPHPLWSVKQDTPSQFTLLSVVSLIQSSTE